MDQWRDPDSLLAPLVVGVHRDAQDHAYFVDATLKGAATCVPPTSVVYKVKPRNSFRTQQRIFRRVTFNVLGEAAKPYLTRVRLVDAEEGAHESKSPSGRFVWEVGLISAGLGTAAPAMSEDLSIICLDVSFAKIVNGLLQGAPQLALLRYLWIEHMRSYDPNLVVMGGQSRFEAAWWQSTEGDESTVGLAGGAGS